jgi:Delta3-Delta2-enoyl-CoA isomerase
MMCVIYPYVGWTEEMGAALWKAYGDANNDPSVKVIILTGTGKYYSAGVNLSGAIKIMAPKRLFQTIVDRNKALFENFLNRKKPTIIAVNGPVIGAPLTSATLCDAILASDTAKFLTPFGRLGVSPEGCSSVHFPYLMGPENAQKMLFEDWEPSATEAKAIGLITDVVPSSDLLTHAQALAEKWIAEGKHLKPMTAMGYEDLDRLREVNAEESIALGHAFLSEKFLNAQVKFLTSKGKTQTAMIFRALLFARPLWSRFL